jgi:ribose-phosphate pyrophosphokinase
LLGGSGNQPLLWAMAQALGLKPEPCVLERFPDGELHVRLERAQQGAHVCIVQPTGPPVDEHLVELVMLSDACRRAGAARLTAAVPYFGYARQDRREDAGEAIGMKAVARLIEAAGIDQLIVVDPHSVALEASCNIPVTTLTAVPKLAAALQPVVDRDAVLVAPDFGAVKLAERYAAILDRPVAVVRKTRASGERVHAVDVIGDVQHRQPVIIDDMITTGATIEAAAHALLDRGCRDELIVAATHGLFVGPAIERLSALPLHYVVVTDTVPVAPTVDLSVAVVGIHDLLGDALVTPAQM